jgi:alpha-glucoside transport system substrate-binding protein
MSSVTARAACCLLALSLCAAAAGCAGTSQAASVTILVPWSGHEYTAFLNVIKPFEQEYGVQVNPESSRALTEDLDADLAALDPPDLADLPSPAAVYYYYKKNDLKPLPPAINLSSYAQPWLGLAELGTSRLYAVPVKADVKGLLWYKTSVVKSPPRTWAALETPSGTTRWCLGLASGSTSGWPGADWVAQILLSTHPVSMYENWLGGGRPWTSAEVRNAWTTWGMLMDDGDAVKGGVSGALTTAFNDAPDEIASGQCELEHGALSATGLPSTKGYGYVPFPSISGASSPVLVSGDFMSLFTDNLNAENLLTYLASYQAQKLWVQQTAGGYAFSADQLVTPANYPPGVQREIAAQFLQADGAMLCFSAEDMMQPDMSTAFENAVLQFIDQPTLLPALLHELQTTQQGAGTSPLANSACAPP